MARMPRDPAEAVELLGITEEGSTVIAVGPELGYVEAMAEAVGTKGKVIVQDPPPDLTARKKAVEIVDELGEDQEAPIVVVWIGAASVHDLRSLADRVSDGGTLWIVLPKGGDTFRAPVTEGDVKKLLLVAGWKETRTATISNERYAVRFHRRR